MYRVMLVDDEAGVRSSIKAKIDWHAAGYRIDSEASNGAEALQPLSERPLPDVLITDVRMPRLDGIDLIKTCKEAYPGLRIIVLSGYSDFEYMKATIQLGVKDYLLKPVVRGELTALLARLAEELEADREREREQAQEELKQNQLLQMMQEQLLWQLVKDEWFSIPAVKERMQRLQLAALAEEGVRAQFVTAEMRIPPGRLDDWNERKDLLHLAFRMICRETAEKRGSIYTIYEVSHPAMMHFLIHLEETRRTAGLHGVVRPRAETQHQDLPQARKRRRHRRADQRAEATQGRLCVQYAGVESRHRVYGQGGGRRNDAGHGACLYAGSGAEADAGH
ncbi:response regulator [Paenibacillus sp. P26]|nr:response regulator [Paenibacillus sp. P26]